MKRGVYLFNAANFFAVMGRKKIENSNVVISQALQTIKFKLDNEGGTLKSEAIMAVMKTSLMPEFEEKRNFVVDEDIDNVSKKTTLLVKKSEEKNTLPFADSI